MDYYREITAVTIHVGVAAAVSYLPTALSYIPVVARVIDLAAIAKVISPATTIALTVTAYALTKLSKKEEEEKNPYLLPLQDRQIYDARVELVKKGVSLLALPFLGFSRGLANMAIAYTSEAIANCIVLHLPESDV